MSVPVTRFTLIFWSCWPKIPGRFLRRVSLHEEPKHGSVSLRVRVIVLFLKFVRGCPVYTWKLWTGRFGLNQQEALNALDWHLDSTSLP